MAKNNFDITTLLNFEPPEFLCNNCTHIFGRSEVQDFAFDLDWLRCPLCGKHYINEEEFHYVKFDDNIFEHSRELANFAHLMEKSLKDKKTPPLGILLKVLLSAQCFIHLTSYGMSHALLGVLKILSQKVDIRGLVSNVDDPLFKEINDHTDENPNLNIVALVATKTYRRVEDQIPHQKLIVIDGLLAFAGSTNFTLSAWRNAREGREHVQIITDLGEIRELHDRLFSQHWYKLNPNSQDYSDEIPF